VATLTGEAAFVCITFNLCRVEATPALEKKQALGAIVGSMQHPPVRWTPRGSAADGTAVFATLRRKKIAAAAAVAGTAAARSPPGSGE